MKLIALLIICSPLFINAQLAIQQKVGQIKEFHLNSNYGNVYLQSASDQSEIKIIYSFIVNEEDRTVDIKPKSGITGNNYSINFDIINPEQYFKKHHWVVNDDHLRIVDPDSLHSLTGNSERKAVYYNHNDMQFTITCMVPSHLMVNISVIYGHINLDNFTGQMELTSKFGHVEGVLGNKQRSLTVDCKYSFIDLAFPSDLGADLDLYSKYGEFYTDLPLVNIKSDQSGYSMMCKYKTGGPKINLKSPYGNIYLRSSSMIKK